MVRIEVITTKSSAPHHGSKHAAGWDILAAHDYVLKPNSVAIIDSDLMVALPEGHYLQLVSRSSFAAKGVIVTGGVIDSDYRNKIGVILQHTGASHIQSSVTGKVCFANDAKAVLVGATDLIIKKGDRIAQGILFKYEQQDYIHVEHFSEVTDRGGGFGTTGVSGTSALSSSN